MDTQPIRIGLVVGQLTYGGAESQVFELAKDLADRHDVTVYCLSAKTDPYGARLVDAGVRVRVLPARSRLDVFRVAALRAALRADRIQVAHAFLFIASAYAYLATRGFGEIRFVASARNCKAEASAVRRWIMRRAFRAADAVICNSREVAAFAELHYDAPPARTRVVYNGVDTLRFSSPRRPHDGYRVGTIGRFEAQKNLALFVRVAREFVSVRADATFLLAGVGSLRTELERRVAELGLAGRVRFTGAVDDVPEFLSSLDQFWLTSDYEGTPNVVLEAMAVGVPVVATAVGGTPEILDEGRAGLLVPPGDLAAFVRAASTLAREPSTADGIATRARELVGVRFSIPAMVAATEAVYRMVAGNGR